MIKHHSEQTCKVMENDIRLWKALKLIDELHVTLDHNEYGVSSHERIHLMEAIKPFKIRTSNILAELAPAPGGQ